MPAALFALVPLRYWLWGAAAVAACLAVAWGYHAIENKGVQKERARIEEANREAERKADAGQATFDACISSGRTWDRAFGVCGSQ